MKPAGIVCLFSVLMLASQAGCARDFEHIMHRWENPSSRDIFVVAHRAAFMEGGRIILPENATPSIKYAIALGVDMVELDVRASQDGHFVLLHDSTVDRTTNGQGEVAALSLAELRKFNLIDEASGELTQYKIPTLEEVYALAKGRIMINLDPKLPVKELGRALLIARDMGVEDQVVLKGGSDTDEQLDAIKTMLSALPFAAEFMPMHRDRDTRSLDRIRKSLSVLKPEAAEMIVGIRADPDKRITGDGGFLFSDAVRKLAVKNSVHLWINTLYIDPLQHPDSALHQLMWNGGRHDVLGLKYPDQVFGFWVRRGATIIQTDEPKFVIEYLEAQGLRWEN